MTKIVLSILLACFALVANAQSGNADSAPAAATHGKRAKIEPLTGEDALTRIDARGTLRVGVAVNAPWVMASSRAFRSTSRRSSRPTWAGSSSS